MAVVVPAFLVLSPELFERAPSEVLCNEPRGEDLVTREFQELAADPVFHGNTEPLLGARADAGRQPLPNGTFEQPLCREPVELQIGRQRVAELDYPVIQ